MNKLGFIGLGIMGKPMALNLLKNNCELYVYDLNEHIVNELVEVGAKASNPLDIGKECEIIFTILPNGAIVHDVLFGQNGVCAYIKENTLVVDMSSVTPKDSKSFADKLKKYNVGFIDAPVSGGEPKAIDGTLAFMAGGNEDDYTKALPYFNFMGASSILVGEVGSGSVTKLTNQIIVNLTIATVSEAFVLAAKAGADPEKVYNAIKGGLAGSTVLDAKIPMMINRNFVPGGKISINHKDIKNVMATAHDLDVPLPLTSQLFEIFQAMKVHGHMDEDHSALVKYFETLSDVIVKKK